MSEGESIKDLLKEMNDKLEGVKEKPKEKKFKLPLKSRVSKGKLKNNYITIIYITENGNLQFMKKQIREGGVIIDGVPHLATADYLLNYKGKPALIIPAWNSKPFSPEDNLEKAQREKNTTYGHKLLLNIMKNETLQLKKKLGMGALIGGIVVLIVIGYLVTQNGGING